MNDVPKDMGQTPGCEEVREHLPLRVAGAFRDAASTDLSAGVEAHLADCRDCADELAFLQVLGAARPSPPANLAVRVVARALGSRSNDRWATPVEEDNVLPFRTRGRAPQWGRWWANPAATAAVLVLAIGMSLVARGGTPGTDAGAVLAAFDAQAAEIWAEDWLVAGAPYLDGVSDETLALLAAGIDP
jgi:hypothetical protein